MIGLGVHFVMAVAFLALSIRTRPLIMLAYCTIAAVNVVGMLRILVPEYANAIELVGLYALLIPFGIAIYLTINILARPSRVDSTQ